MKNKSYIRKFRCLYSHKEEEEKEKSKIKQINEKNKEKKRKKKLIKSLSTRELIPPTRLDVSTR